MLELDTFAAAGAIFGQTTPAHFLLVGVAYQTGALPISAAAIERAIEINGVGAEDNVAAFRWGRTAVPTRRRSPPSLLARAVHQDRCTRFPAAR